MKNILIVNLWREEDFVINLSRITPLLINECAHIHTHTKERQTSQEF